MVANDVIARIEADIPGARVQVSGDGSRMEIQVISDVFERLSRVQRQQKVYACISALIQAGTLHAVTLRTQTPAESDSPR